MLTTTIGIPAMAGERWSGAGGGRMAGGWWSGAGGGRTAGAQTAAETPALVARTTPREMRCWGGGEKKENKK
jgi:hypothetical protein